MDIRYVTYTLDGLLTLAIPIALGIYVTRKYELYWRLWWVGVAIYVLSQVILLPFETYAATPLIGKVNNNPALSAIMVLILSALILGLSTAFVEELLRYAMFRWWAKEARTWATGFLTGIGHGGAAAILLGALVLYNFINMAYVRNSDLSKFVTAEQLPLAQAQVNAFWAVPWYLTLNELIQQVFTIPVQICLALIVMQTFVRKQSYWLLIAIVFHTLFETTRVVVQNLTSGFLVDLVIAVFGITSIVIIFIFKRSDAAQAVEPFPAKS
jgi:uncharacterized membrane protein YhfC